MKKAWSKLLTLFIIVGCLLLTISFYLRPSILYTKSGGFDAGIIGLLVLLLAIFLAKKTNVTQEIDANFEEIEHGKRLESAELLKCNKCNKTFINEDLRGYVCPYCSIELSIETEGLSNQ